MYAVAVSVDTNLYTLSFPSTCPMTRPHALIIEIEIENSLGQMISTCWGREGENATLTQSSIPPPSSPAVCQPCYPIASHIRDMIDAV